MDIADTLAAKSDQIGADDLIGGERTITVTGVKVAAGEQPVSIFTAEFGDGRPFKPCLTMRRALTALWGPDTSVYTGRRMVIYRDAEVTFGNDKPGGVRISHLSHIDKTKTVWLKAKRGKSKPFAFDPLPDAPAALPTVTPEAAAEFERDIAEAATIQALDAVAKDLKACDLGSHRARLLTSWSERKSVIEAAPVDGDAK